MARALPLALALGLLGLVQECSGFGGLQYLYPPMPPFPPLPAGLPPPSPHPPDRNVAHVGALAAADCCQRFDEGTCSNCVGYGCDNCCEKICVSMQPPPAPPPTPPSP
eukprot:scaffold20743_cov62-Phaeocystis_antarctica.AAC.1